MCRLSRVGWIGSFGRARSPPIEEAETGLHVYCTKINPSSPCLCSMHMHRSCVDHAWIFRRCCRSVKLVTAASGFERATDAPLRIHFGLSILNATRLSGASTCNGKKLLASISCHSIRSWAISASPSPQPNSSSDPTSSYSD